MNKTLTSNGLFYESADRQDLIIKLRGILMSSSVEISEGQLFGRMTYFAGKAPVAFICIKRDRKYIELGFFKAIYLEDPKKLFSGNSKEIRRIKISSVKEIPVAQIKRWVKQSIILLKK